MKILLICSAKFEDREREYAIALEGYGHEVLFTAGHDDPRTEGESLLKYGARMMRKSITTILTIDAVLCLNFDKDGQRNYIGGATFCEMAYAFEHEKKIFILNDLPDDPKIRFEVEMFNPVMLYSDLGLVK